MSRQYLMGLDIGGGGGRSLLVDTDTGETTCALRAWSFPSAPDTGGVGFDADPEAILSKLCDASKEAIGRARASAEEVVGLAVTAFRLGTVVVDGDGQVLYAGPNSDARAARQGMALAAEHGVEWNARTGRWPNPAFPVVRLLWLAEHDAQAFARASKVLSFSDWVAYRLCGRLATDCSQAGETGIFDLTTRGWAYDLAEKIGLPRHIFPDVVEAGSTLGTLSAYGAQALGLRAGIPIAVGGADTQCGLLGVGATAPGAIGIIAGTSAPIQLVLDTPVIDSESRVWSGRHVMKDRFVLEANAGPIGEALDWFGRVLHPASPQPAAALLGAAALAEPGAGGLLSTFGAQLPGGRQLRLPIGRVTLPHLFPPATTGPPELARAVVEGVAYALRKNLEVLLHVAKRRADRILLGGGMSPSRVFGQLLGDVLGLRVEVGDTAESTALGAAICAGVGAGLFSDIPAGVQALVRTARTHEPEAEGQVAYNRRYADWERLRVAETAADDVAQELKITSMLNSRREGAPVRKSRHRPRILVTAALDTEAIAALTDIGDVEYRSFREHLELLTGPTLVAALRSIEVFITEVDVVDLHSLREAKDLRVIATCRADPVNVDIHACSAFGVPVLNAPGRNADAVADLTIAFALSLARALPEASAFLRDAEIEAGDMGMMGKAFATLQGRELWRKTFGLVGFGAVGRKVAARLTPFGARVVAYDPLVTPEQAAYADAELVSLDRLLEESDFVSLHAPATETTKGMMGVAQFAKMKPGAFFINTARAALVDEGALVEALSTGHLAGAAVDVFAIEPPGADHPLLQLPHVITTPHVGGNTVEVATHQGRIIADDLRRLLDGLPPRFALNPECLDTFDFGTPRPEPDSRVLEELAERPKPAVSDLQMDRQVPTQPSGASAPAPEDQDMATKGTDQGGAIAQESRQAMARIIRAFVENLIADAEIRKAGIPDVSLHFRIPDIGQEFFFAFTAGNVEAGVGPPPAAADVQLKMKAYILDGMFTGKVNAMEKAMGGELSFVGDAAKAMALQQLQDPLSRLYGKARDATGDPGDLEPSSVAEAQKKRLAVGSVAAGPGARPLVGDERDELVQIVDELYSSRLITSTGGNVSLRVRANPDAEIWITPSSLFKGNLGPEILVRIDIAEGQPLDEDARSPSSERLMHCAVYKNRPAAGAVIHAHAPNATILANTGLPFLPISTEAAFFGNIPRLPFLMPGTAELADAVGEAMKDSWAVLLQNHGLIVAGRTLRRAADMADVIERAAEIILGCHAVGKEPPVLPDSVVKTLRQMGDMVA